MLSFDEASAIISATESQPSHLKQLVDGRFAYVFRFMFTVAILVTDERNIRYGYSDRWCYESMTDAIAALEEWDGTTAEPEGWHRHPDSGRRRPNGDAAKEYVNL